MPDQRQRPSGQGWFDVPALKHAVSHTTTGLAYVAGAALFHLAVTYFLDEQTLFAQSLLFVDHLGLLIVSSTFVAGLVKKIWKHEFSGKDNNSIHGIALCI